MASFNHHPYLPEVLAALQKHQMFIESTSAGLKNEHPDHQQIFIELPWKNDAQEWAEVDDATRKLIERERLRKEGKKQEDGFFARLTGTFNVDGTNERQWEDDTEELKYALRAAGEEVYETNDDGMNTDGTYAETSSSSSNTTKGSPNTTSTGTGPSSTNAAATSPSDTSYPLDGDTASGETNQKEGEKKKAPWNVFGF